MLFGKRKAGKQDPPTQGAGARPGGAPPDAVLRDELGLHQLWYLEHRLRDELARSSRSNAVFSVAAWQVHLLPGEEPDIERMTRAGEIITSSLRSYDIVSRLDEARFVAILLDSDYENATTVAFRIKSDLQLRVTLAGKWRAGASSFPRDGVDADGLIQATLRRLAEDARAA
jgi:hypothetical protein